eukprot:TRINITY_DN2322_c0_g1_i2.p1 TRINITY_DN2322_c0_g1~~TRINITY_DN2322_c0_g1_i2.p1  ORF type:complete len:638 (-),score=181.03 TRINITY_DN2322_c0_g1_i2:461-2374(-)
MTSQLLLAQRYGTDVARSYYALCKKYPVRTFLATLAVEVAVSRLVSLYMRRVRRHTVLELELGDKIIHEASLDFTTELIEGDKFISLRTLVESIDVASNDNRVDALIIRMQPSFVTGFASLQEIRAALVRFASKKPVWLYTHSIGEFSNAAHLMYLASACTRIYVPPSGDVHIQNLMGEVMFLKGTLDKLGLAPRLSKRKEYKNAVNMLTDTELNPAHREATQTLLAGVMDQMVAGIALGRGRGEAKARKLFSQSPFSALEAKHEGLIDDALYLDEVDQALLTALSLTKKTQNRLLLSKYFKQVGTPYKHKIMRKKIALLSFEGNILVGTGKGPSSNTEGVIGSDTVVAALRTAASSGVRAIVLRINSPGGSYIASDLIYHEIIRIKATGIPVVVSMGDLAASGGYFIACASSYIVAQPGTLTGSIGVFAGKILTREMWGKLGVTWDTAWPAEGADVVPPPSYTRSGTQYSNLHDYDEAQRAVLEKQLDRIYHDFVTKVAAGRGMTFEAAEALAHGRVWLGSQAHANGLVDMIGGLHDAVEQAKRLAGMAPHATPELCVFPRSPSLMSMLSSPTNWEQKDSRGAMASIMGANIGALRGIMHLMNRAAPALKAVDAVWGGVASECDTLLFNPELRNLV